MDITLGSLAESKSDISVDFNAIPVRALNISSRIALSRYLNPEMRLPTSTGLVRDYRGLTEVLGFDMIDLMNFQRSEDPTSKLLQAWEKKPGSTVGVLLARLEEMERHDVIEDTKHLLERDACAYLQRNQSLVTESPLQVAEVSSGERFPLDNPEHLTVADLASGEGEITKYDAFVCYADEDIAFVEQLSKVLEAPEIGISLCIRHRDLLLGTMTTDTLIKLIEERCYRMIVILSPEFLKSPECDFQTKFASSLAIEQRQRKIIPILYKPCKIPSLLQIVTKVDFTKTDIHQWIWRKLIISIKGASGNSFIDWNSPALSAPKMDRLPIPPSTSQLSLPSVMSSESSGFGSFPSLPTTSSPSLSQPQQATPIARSASPISNRKGGLSLFKRFIGANTSSSSGYEPSSSS